MGYISVSRRAALAAFAAAMIAAPAYADYPERTITFVVPYSAGGSTDIAARIIAERLGERLGTAVIVDNRPGGAGLIGANYVAKAKPDGYTLLVTGNGLASLPSLDNPAFDLEKELVPVSRPVEGALIFLASPHAPFSTVEEFLEYARANPGEINGATPGALGASQLALERFRMEAGFDYMPIHYAGNAPAAAALMSGEIHFGVDAATSARSFVESGNIVGLAVTTAERFAQLPDVPTVSETVQPGYSDGYSTIVMAPAGTPEEIIDRVAAEIAELVREPETEARLQELGVSPVGGTPEEFAASFKEEIERYATIIADLRERNLLNN